MCGIIACTSTQEVRPLLLNGLRHLEYRGYDSAGLAVLTTSGQLEVHKKAGRVDSLAAHLPANPPPAHLGISHTRWATHGEPSDSNAHPHLDQSGLLALVHNGTIENHADLKSQLLASGHHFLSDTDTEVLAHLVGQHYDASSASGPDRLTESLRLALASVKGTFALAVIHKDLPDIIVGTRRGSPLVLGLGQHQHFLASDAAALLPHTRKVIFLNDLDITTISPDNFSIASLGPHAPAWQISELSLAPDAASRGSFPHFMLKEIHEQPLAISRSLHRRLDHDNGSTHLDQLGLSPGSLHHIDRVCIIGCGSALYAGMTGARMIESTAFLPADTEIAGEFRSLNRPLSQHSLVITVSQSGETADSLAALREARRKGARTLALTNHPSSSLAREADATLELLAGPEIGVAATKSFVSQLSAFALLSLALGRLRHLPHHKGLELILALENLPAQINAILAQSDSIAAIAARFAASPSMLFLGRGLLFPIALEGALKMKEISYIHAAGFAASELKHGVIALIDPHTPSVCLCPDDDLLPKNLGTIHEIKARRGPVIAITSGPNPEIDSLADAVIRIPTTLDLLQPILHTIPLQLLAYHTALALGRDIDKPRNLAKSVTVD
jgi:glucosamine--fructose-6-phosphate aminotransferase (isomerizing)